MKPLLIGESFNFEQYEKVVILSPHLDDAVLSCGGLLTSFSPEVSRLVVSVTCGNPVRTQSQMDSSGIISVETRKAKERKGYAPSRVRRKEDIAAMDAVDCDHLHLGFPDAIYRRSPITGKLIYKDVIGKSSYSREDSAYIDDLYAILKRLTHDMGKVLLISPMATGGHVDHIICMNVALRLAYGSVSLLFYEDWPYVVRGPLDIERLSPPPTLLTEKGMKATKVYYQPVDVGRKTDLILTYDSQVSRLFRDADEIPDLISRRQIGDIPCEIFWKFSANS